MRRPVTKASYDAARKRLGGAMKRRRALEAKIEDARKAIDRIDVATNEERNIIQEWEDDDNR